MLQWGVEMKKIPYVLVSIVLIVLTACSKKMDYSIEQSQEMHTDSISTNMNETKVVGDNLSPQETHSTGDLSESLAELSGFKDLFESALQKLQNNKNDEAELQLLEIINCLDDFYGETVEIRSDVEFALGVVHIERDDYRKAYDYFNSALQYYREQFAESHPKILDTKLYMAEIEMNYYEREEQALRTYLEIYEISDSPLYRDTATCLIMRSYMSLDNGTATEMYLPSVKKIIETGSIENEKQHLAVYRDDEPNYATALRKTRCHTPFLYAWDVLSNYYHNSREIDLSLQMNLDALNFIDRNRVDEIEKYGFYKNLSVLQILHLDVEEGIKTLERMKELIDKHYRSSVERAGMYITLSQIYNNANYREQSTRLLNDAIAITKEIGGTNHSLVSLAIILLSQNARYFGDNQKAVSLCLEAIEIKKNLLDEDLSTLGSYYNNLANCYAASGDMDNAVQAYEKSIEIYDEAQDYLQVAVAKRNMALITNNSMGDHKSAMIIAREAIACAESLDQSIHSKTLAAIYMLMVYIAKPSDVEYSQIEEYADRAYKCLLNAVGDSDEEKANYHYYLGVYFKDVRHFIKATEHFSKAELLFGAVYGDPKFFPIDIFIDMATCWKLSGYYDNAKEYYQKSITYSDEVVKLRESNGNYNNSYWVQNKAKAQKEIDSIYTYQNRDENSLLEGKYLCKNDEIVVHKNNDEGELEFRLVFSQTIETDIISIKLVNNLGDFDYRSESFNGIITSCAGQIECFEDEIVVNILSSSDSRYIPAGKRVFTYHSTDDLLNTSMKKLYLHTNERVWKLSFQKGWQRETYLEFHENGTLSIRRNCDEDNSEYDLQVVEYCLLSLNRILVGEEEYYFSIVDESLDLNPIHSDELMLYGSFYLVDKPDTIDHEENNSNIEPSTGYNGTN